MTMEQDVYLRVLPDEDLLWKFYKWSGNLYFSESLPRNPPQGKFNYVMNEIPSLRLILVTSLILSPTRGGPSPFEVINNNIYEVKIMRDILDTQGINDQKLYEWRKQTDEFLMIVKRYMDKKGARVKGSIVNTIEIRG